MTVPEHDDNLADAVALTECAGNGDELAARAVMFNMNAAAVSVVLARLLAALVAENAAGRVVTPEYFREWALDSARRP